MINEESLINARSTDESKETKTAFVLQGNKAKRRPGKCNFCGKPGHWARECYKRQQTSKQRGRNERSDSHSMSVQKETTAKACASTLNEEANHLFVLHSKNAEGKIRDEWYADSGATDHMSFQGELFHNFTAFSKGACQVKVGDGRRLEVKGVGDINVQTGMSKEVCLIKDVLLVPNLDRNFISVSRVTEKGVKVIFAEGGKRVYFEKNGVAIASGEREDRLYKMHIRVLKESELQVATTSMRVWHERLGHVNFETLREMSAKEMVKDLHIDNTGEANPFCEGCVYGKQHRFSFPKSAAKRSAKTGEVFHVDLCGKMSTPSIGGANYFMLLKDDYSRYSFIYFLKYKTDALDNLMKFCTDVEADGHQVKRLRSDGGLEFCNASVDKFLLKKGIKHEITTPRAPEQNGFIERQNRTIVECAKAMLHMKNLPLHLWAEASNTAVYLKNRTASNVIGGMTSYEKWFGTKPSASHLRIFGSEVYMHIPKEQRTKWEKNSIKGVMIGYNDASKAYRIYEPYARKIFIRRDVIFNECHDSVHEVREPKHVEQEIKSTENECERKTYKNPRIPFPRSPYFTRKRNKENSERLDGNETVGEVCIAEIEPNSLEEALNCDDANMWLAAIQEEIKALHKTNTWTLVSRTPGMHVISNRWVFKKKFKANGEIDRFKARLVVRGCAQKHGVDYTEVFSPVVRYESVRAIFAIAAAEDFEIFQFDIKTAFLHGVVEETIFMEQPYGFEEDDRVCLLKKGLYGLKQASRQWNKRIVEFLRAHEFYQSTADACVFICNKNSIPLFLALYVDDGLLCGNNKPFIKTLLEALNSEFEIVFKEAEFFVGFQILRDREKRKLKIFQSAYTKRVLERFYHLDCIPVSTTAEPGIKFSQAESEQQQMKKFPFQEAIGSLMYLMIITRPDIAYSVSVLSRFMERPTEIHWNGIKRIFKYLKGSQERGIIFKTGTHDSVLSFFCDSDWGGDVDTRRSTSGWIAFLNGGPIAWSSKKQSVTATSTTEAEFVALCAATKSAVWLRKLLTDLGYKQSNPTLIKCDNQRAISLVKSPESSKRTKHIDIQYFYTCDMQQEGEISVEFVPTKDQLADALTKALPKDQFNTLINQCALFDN